MVFIGGLGVTTRPDSVRARLTPFGDVVDVDIVTDPRSGAGRGFCFVTFGSAEGAARAVADMNGAGIDGHEVCIVSPGQRRVTSTG